jgi:hypothetical protein
VTSRLWAGGVADADALRGPFLDHRTQFFRDLNLTWLDVVVPVAMGGLVAYFSAI